MENENEVVVPETTEEVTPEVTTPNEEEGVEETLEEVKARLTKAEELANNYKIRAEKAEKKAKEGKEVVPQTPTPKATESTNNLTDSDLLALMKSNVHEDDVDRVKSFAKSEGITVKDALKNDELKAILDIRAEKRTTAQVTHTGNSRRGSTKMSDEVLLDKASKGDLPESPEEIERLMKLKRVNK